MNRSHVDVVVCAHNEEATVAGILRAIRGAPEAGKIILVADTCDDRTVELSEPLATVVVPVTVKDKGSAMAAGLRHVDTSNVAFVDADLVGLEAHHISALLGTPPPSSMVVGLRAGYPVSFGAFPSLSGERRVPTQLASEARLEGSGWEAELRINAMAAKVGLPWSHLLMHGVTNPHRPKVKEWVQVAGAAIKNGPGLIRYMAAARRVQ